MFDHSKKKKKKNIFKDFVSFADVEYGQITENLQVCYARLESISSLIM